MSGDPNFVQSQARSPKMSTVSSGTIQERLDPRANSFGFLRLSFALLVIVSHAFALGGFNNYTDPLGTWTKGQEDFGSIAVTGFFVISGYLVTRSYAESGTAVRYLWKRILRIFPGFLVCLVVTAFIFGPWAYRVQYGHFGGYFSLQTNTPLGYIYHNARLTIHQWNIGNLLAATPYQHDPNSHAQAFNGSLWTLIYEFKCYLGVAILGCLGILWRSRLTVLGICIVLWAMQIKIIGSPDAFSRVPMLADANMLRFAFIFSLGMVLYLYRENIPISNTLAAVALITMLVSLRESFFLQFGILAFAYLCLWCAAMLPIKNVERFGDYSYGIYIYGFIVEQMLGLYGVQKWGYVPYLLLAIFFSFVCAAGSWFLIEKRFIGFKRFRLSEGPKPQGELRGLRRVWNPSWVTSGSTRLSRKSDS
jgi:peptidoglycan/LPS O-acetylase OafA/YrhL